uniref:Niban apoptosis regulator 1b n=1 Tax=Astyanax mexicanus TaxID=7994 RepID=A0A8B9HDP7_ASTMX
FGKSSNLWRTLPSLNLVTSELKNFSPHYRRQYCVAFFSQLHDEVEQHRTGPTQLLKHKEPSQASAVLYKNSVQHFDDSRKWKERFVVVRSDYSLELHDSQETFNKGTPARHTLLLTGGTVLTSEEKYSALVDKAFPDLNSSKEDGSPPVVTVPGPFAVYLRLPYRRDWYFSFQQEEQQIQFISILSDCIRHQNSGKLNTHTLILWFTTVEATYVLVQEQLREGLQSLKEECREAAKQQEALIRSDMDQIINSRTFLQTKLQGLVSEPAVKFCSESVAPYLASILEELMGPVSSGFQAVRQRLEAELSRVCRDFTPGGGPEELTKTLDEVGRAQLEDCYQHVTVLKEQLQELRNRFKFSNSTLLVHTTQSHMQQVGLRVQLGTITGSDGLTTQYDYDSSTVRKKIFQDALVDITLPAIRRNLAPSCKTELQNYEQHIFADYTNFIQVENVYEDLLLNILNNEVNKVVKEAASLKKNNLFVDSTDLQCISQSSLNDSRTPPLSAPSSPSKVPLTRKPEENTTSPLVGNGCLESQSKKQSNQDIPAEENQEIPAEASSPGDSSPACEVAATASEAESKTEVSAAVDPSLVPCDTSADKPDVAPSTLEAEAQSEAESQCEAVTVTTLASLSLNDCPAIVISKDPGSSSEQQQATDKAVYLIPPAGVAAGSAVPLAEDEEKENMEAQTVSEPETSAPVEPCIGTPKPEASTIEVPTDSESKDNDDPTSPMETTSSDPSGPSVDCTVRSEPLIQSDATGKDTVVNEKDSQELSSNTVPLVEGENIPESVPILSGGDADCSSSSDADGEEPLDCIKAIRDLVVEVIEVEDIVKPCPTSSEA